MPEINEQKHPRDVSEGLPEQVITRHCSTSNGMKKILAEKKIANMYLSSAQRIKTQIQFSSLK